MPFFDFFTKKNTLPPPPSPTPPPSPNVTTANNIPPSDFSVQPASQTECCVYKELPIVLPENIEPVGDFHNFVKTVNRNLYDKNTNLTPDQIDWIRGFIQSTPNALNDVLAKIQTCSIELHDIPNIIFVISNIYHTAYLKQLSQNPKYVLILIQISLLTLIEMNIITLPNADKELIDYAITASFCLLSLNLGVLENDAKQYCGNWKCC
jgi:hypothetical protein